MKLAGLLLLLVGTLGSCAGCAMCCSPYDDHYSAFGGRWQRDDMRDGRVGSAFGPAGAIHETSPTIVEGESYIEPGY